MYPNHARVRQVAGERVLAIQQGRTIRAIGHIVTQQLDRHQRLGLAMFLGQQVAGAVDHAHTAGAQQTFEFVTPVKHWRQHAG
ncbi:hypothetical protein D3C80_1777310 [compost metagenome]